MATTRRAVLHAVLVDHDHGHWCNDCLLATGVRAFVVVTAAERMNLHEVAWCAECGGRDIVCDPVDDARRCR